MIITVVKHGRSKGDSQALAAHLAKTENSIAELACVGNCLAETVPEALSVMEVYRQAANVTAAFLHCTINPAKMLPRQALLQCVDRIRRELDPELSRPFVVVVHKKARAKGGASEHAHLILCLADHNSKLLDDKFTIIRTERCARELEYDVRDVEIPLRGRHHAAALRALRKSRPEVAQWLERAHGTDPVKPESSISPGSRNQARSRGFKLPTARAFVETAWGNANGEISTFIETLTVAGFEIAPGNRESVWIIQDNNGNFVGSVDRILRMRRGTFDNTLTTVALSNSQALLPNASTSMTVPDRPHKLALCIAVIVAAAARARKHRAVELEDACPPSPGPVRTDLWGIVLLPPPPKI